MNLKRQRIALLQLCCCCSFILTTAACKQGSGARSDVASEADITMCGTSPSIAIGTDSTKSSNALDTLRNHTHIDGHHDMTVVEVSNQKPVEFTREYDGE